MTRINCIPVARLHNKHLLAEYKELPAVFTFVQRRVDAGDPPKEIPATYRLGPGHMTFFYDKLTYLQKRYNEICKVLIERGYNLNRRHLGTEFANLPDEYWNDWIPDEMAQLISEARIQNSLRAMKERGTL